MLSNLILIYILYNIITLLLGYYNPNILSCGLVGHCGKRNPDYTILKLLGMMNVSRGEHSCGIAINDVVYKGIEQTAKFGDFLYYNPLPKLITQNKNVIIHTRKASRGLKTKKNAHPFGFTSTDGGSAEFFGAHNGTLSYDWRNLLEKRKIDPTSIDVDSKALLFRLYHDKSFRVLSEYEGAAALLFYWTNRPNVFYAWKGGAGDEEERPLYFWQKKNQKGEIMNTYFSSIKESLIIASNHDIENIFQVANNQLLEFTEGEVTRALFIRRDSDKNLGNVSNSNDETTQTHPKGKKGEQIHKKLLLAQLEERLKIQREKKVTIPVTKQNHTPPKSTYSTNSKVSIQKKSSNKFIKRLDVFAPEKFHNYTHNNQGEVYFHLFRYWRNGHLLSGGNIINLKTRQIVAAGINTEETMIKRWKKMKEMYNIHDLYAAFFVEGVSFPNFSDYIKCISKGQFITQRKNGRYTAEHRYLGADHPTVSIIRYKKNWIVPTNGDGRVIVYKNGKPIEMSDKYENHFSPFIYYMFGSSSSLRKCKLVTEKPTKTIVNGKKTISEKYPNLTQHSLKNVDVAELAMIGLIDFCTYRAFTLMSETLEPVFDYVSELLENKTVTEGIIEFAPKDVAFMNALANSYLTE